MLQINIVKKRKKVSGKILGIDFALINKKLLIISLVILFVPEMALVEFYNQQIGEVQTQISNLQAQKKKIIKQIKDNEHLKLELEAYNEKIRELKDKEEQVAKIVKQKTNPKNLLERLARTIPEDVWFTELEIKSDRTIKLSGESTSYRSIGKFVNAAKQSSFFDKNLKLKMKKNKKKNYDGNEVRVEQFEITGKVIAFNPF